MCSHCEGTILEVRGRGASPFEQPLQSGRCGSTGAASSLPRALWGWINTGCSPWEGMGTHPEPVASHSTAMGAPQGTEGGFSLLDWKWCWKAAQDTDVLAQTVGNSWIQDIFKPRLIHQLNSLYSCFCIIKAEWNSWGVQGLLVWNICVPLCSTGTYYSYNSLAIHPK